MKHLKYYMEEVFATPADTLGMGNPMMPALPETPGEMTPDEGVGSGDQIKKKKKRNQPKRSS